MQKSTCRRLINTSRKEAAIFNYYLYLISKWQLFPFSIALGKSTLVVDLVSMLQTLGSMENITFEG